MPLANPGAGFWSGARVSLGASWDRGSTPETGGREARETIDDWGARVGGSAQIGSRVRFHMGASRRVRFPSLRELYSGALGRFVPNHELAPEVLRAAEGGVTGTVEALGAEVDAQAVFFVQSLSNAIVRTGLGDGRFRRENRRRVDAAGIELLGDARWGAVSLGGDLTWQNVNVTDRRLEGRTLRAEYQPGIAVGAHVEGLLPAGFRARAAVEAIGRQYCVDPDADGDIDLDPTARVDLVVSREFAVSGPSGRSSPRCLWTTLRTRRSSISADCRSPAVCCGSSSGSSSADTGGRVETPRRLQRRVYGAAARGSSIPDGEFLALRRILERDGIIRAEDIVEPEEAAWEDLALVHTPEYLYKLRHGTLVRAEERRLGLPWSPALVRRSRLAVRGTIDAAGWRWKAEWRRIWPEGRTMRFRITEKGSAC